ncbi:MAG: aspartate-semialdehyde dehydrogenase [Oscillospiraceae bacterium]|jgi:aspartate-semialdehyde dehydrogenase|nr:aspartate-semialdehyde dehydrogenase [Oscillospiraceae bacterium]
MSISKKFKVAVIGATGMVGQRFVTLLDNHPWFELSVVAASPRSAGKSYAEAVSGKWLMSVPLPEAAAKLTVLDATADIAEIAASVDFAFCAVDMPDKENYELEVAYAKAECPIVSNNKSHRWTPDVPMVVPELNPEHVNVIAAQRKRLGTKRGFISVKSNCSIQNYVPALSPVRELFPISDILVCTYQAISGASKNFETWPEMIDNVIPYIGGEEEKSEREPLKLWGEISGGEIVPADAPRITAQCIRVPVTNGHLAAAFVRFAGEKPSKERIIEIWDNFKSPVAQYNLPSAPKKFLNYFTEDNRPQIRLDRELENGMAVSIGRLREDTQYDYKFVCLSHNTLLGAAGGGVLLAELLAAKGYFER